MAAVLRRLGASVSRRLPAVAASPAALPRLPLPWPSASSTLVRRVAPHDVTRSASTKASAAQASGCSLEFRDGTLRLRLPIPGPGLDDAALFYAAPSDSVESLLTAIQQDRPMFADVSIDFPSSSDRLSPVLSSMTVSQLTTSQFNISYDGNTFTVIPDDYMGGAYGIGDQEGRLELRSLLQKGAFARVRKQLDAIKTPYIPYSEFTRICDESGVPAVEAAQLCKQLHRVGIILHFHEEPALRNVVFLDPEDVVDSVFAKFGLLGPRAALVQELRAEVQTELDAVVAKLEDKRATQLVVEQAAQWWATQFNRVVGVSLGAGTVAYMYLAYVELSWDIMEPVTYFTATAVSLFGYWWWLATSAEFEYSNIYTVVLNWRRRVKYRQLAKEAADAAQASPDADVDFSPEDASNPLAPADAPADYGFSASIEALERRMQGLQQRLDELK